MNTSFMSTNRKALNLKYELNMKSANVILFLIIGCLIFILMLVSCNQNKTDKDIIKSAFNKYGTPVSITTIRIHNGTSLYEYQSNKLFSVLKSPNDTVDVSQIVFRDNYSEYIIWTTMKNDSLVIVDELEYNYHLVRF